MSDTFLSSATDTQVSLPDGYDGFYTCKIEMNNKATPYSAHNKLWRFFGKFDFILGSSVTDDSDGTPEIEIPLTIYHKKSTHGKAKLIFQPSANDYKVHLIWDSVDSTAYSDGTTVDVLPAMKITMKREVW